MIPIRNERDAFRLTVEAVACVGAGLLLGVFLSAPAGAILAAVLLIAFVAAELGRARRARRRPLAEAAGEAPPASRRAAGRPRRVLLVACEAPAGATVREELSRSGSRPPELEVLAPVLQSRTQLLMSDADEQREQARRRLRETLAWARAEGLRARGALGDEIAPLTHLEDELRAQRFDEVLILTQPEEQENWLARTLGERALAELTVPVRILPVGPLAR